MGLGHSPRIITNGLVGYWDAGNPKSYPGSGTIWNDLSGNGNDGTLTNGPTFNSGSLVFDGTNDVATLPASHSFANATIGLWLYLDETINWATRFDILNSSILANTNGRFVFYSSNSTTLQVYHLFSGLVARTTNINNANTSFTGKWKYVAITSQNVGSNITVSVYVDGILNSTYTVAGQATATDSSMYLMRSNDGVRPTKGKVSLFHIYNRALSATEISQNFNALRGRFGI